MKRNILIVLPLLFSRALASSPTIGSVSVVTDTNTAVVAYTVSPDSYCWVRYGITPGTYLWSSVTFQSGSPFVTGLCSVPINGLADGTTYYFLPTARPDPDDETNGCMTVAQNCGTSELVATTPAASVSHLPAAPTAVQSNLTIEPDTTGPDNYANAYVVVPLAATGTEGECVSTAAVSAPAGYSGSISPGDSLTTIFGASAGAKLWYGTIFQVPQGTTCIVPRSSARGRGYEIPPMAVDPDAAGGLITASNHRWIVFRTVQVNASDFPPFGSRTNPSFASKMGGFQSPNYNTVDTAFDTNGTIFDATGPGQVHHFWIENLTFSVNASNLQNYDVFFLWGRGDGGQTPPFPQYIVMRDNYFHGPVRGTLTSGVPSIQGVLFATMQSNMQYAIVGNYADNLYYTAASGIPQAYYFSDCGFTGTCGHGGPVLFDNNYAEGSAMDIYVEVNNHSNPNPVDFTITHNYLYWPYSITYRYAVSIGSYGCRNQIEMKGMTRGLIAGNYINGQWACANSGNAILTFNNVDLTIKSNYITNSTSGFGLNGSGNSSGMASYSSSGNRILVSNNLLHNLGRTLFQAGGGGLGADAIEMDSSPSNVTIANNTFGPIGNDNPVGPYPGYFYPWILFNGGGGQLAGLNIQSNIFPFGLGLTSYGGGIGVQNALIYAPGAQSHPATPIPSGSVSPVAFASWLGTVAGYTAGTAGLGMQGASIISGGSGYASSGSLSFSNCSSAPAGTFTASGGVVGASFSSFGSGCTPSTFTVSASGSTGASLRPAYGLTTSYTWGGNVNYCTSYQGSDMTSGICSSASSTMPSGDIWASGSSTTARLAAAGVSSDYSITPTTANAGNVGANLNEIYATTGTTTNVSVTVAATFASINYYAPDSRACSADFSADGTTWTRATDSGGPPSRSLVLTGLIADAPYNYRLLCYFDQTSDLFSGGQITDGTFSTLAAGTRNRSFTFALSAFPGATSFKVTLTPISGPPYSNVCTASPCVVSDVPVGDYSAILQWLAGTTPLGASDAQLVGVR